MSKSEMKALERALDRLAKPPKRRAGWFSIAPIYLGLGLVLGYILLVRLVPMIWSALLPGGIEQAQHLTGLPAVVWRLSVLFRVRSEGVVLILGGLVGAGFLVSTLLRPLRFLVWLAAVALVLVDAGILIVTIKTALEATMQGAGIG
jgi:hypothetical protein